MASTAHRFSRPMLTAHLIVVIDDLRRSILLAGTTISAFVIHEGIEIWRDDD